MHGTKLLTVIALRCVVCKKFVAMRVDPDDLRRHRNGMLVQDAFADSNGAPYLDAASREMLVSGVCGDCWILLCPDPATQRYN